MILRIALAILALIGVIVLLGGIYASNIMAMIQAGEAMSGPYPETVQISAVEEATWQESVRSIGSVTAVQGALLRAEAEGRVEEILFTPGSEVAQGDVLLKQNVAVEESQLVIAQSTLRLAEITLNRTRELFRRESIAQADLDAAEINFERSQAEVANLQAVMALKTITAPFAGQLGVQRLSVGDYLTRGQEIVSLQAKDPVRVDFNLPQSELFKIKGGMRVSITTDAWPDTVFEGELTAIEPQINLATRTFSAQATVANAEGLLRSGMFVRVELFPESERTVILVPQTAIRFATYGDAVFVVVPAENGQLQKVRQQRVVTGETRGDFVEIREGLNSTDEIVASGVFKLRDGSLITHSDIGTVEPKLNPQPINR